LIDAGRRAATSRGDGSGGRIYFTDVHPTGGPAYSRLAPGWRANGRIEGRRVNDGLFQSHTASRHRARKLDTDHAGAKAGSGSCGSIARSNLSLPHQCRLLGPFATYCKATRPQPLTGANENRSGDVDWRRTTSTTLRREPGERTVGRGDRASQGDCEPRRTSSGAAKRDCRNCRSARIYRRSRAARVISPASDSGSLPRGTESTAWSARLSGLPTLPGGSRTAALGAKAEPLVTGIADGQALKVSWAAERPYRPRHPDRLFGDRSEPVVVDGAASSGSSR
jgi:hypothetical protein